MLRIGINALYLIPGGVGGTEIYLRELLAALARIDCDNEFFVFRNLETGEDLVPRAPNFHDKPQAVRAQFRPARILWEQTILPLETSRYRLDVLFNPGFTAPVFASCACVTTFHDLQHKRHPEYFRWFDLPFWNLLLWASAKRSRVLADSQATRSDLEKFYPFTSGRVRVIPLGVSPDFFALDRSRIENFVLCVSTLHPHKNLERLIRAFAKWPGDSRLVLAGMRGFQAAQIDALIDELRLRDRVRLTGWVPRKELLDLYARARAFLYPSTFEGFGIPVLEAIAAGIPVACSNIPPLREVANEAALYFDPSNEDEIAAALERITQDEDLRGRLAAGGPPRARLFSWENTARMTRDALIEST